MVNNQDNLFFTSVNNDVSRRESGESQETSVQKRRSSVIKTQKNSPRPQSSEHTAVDLNHNESTTEMYDKLLTEPTPPPAPPISIFLQTADFLLNVNALVVSASKLHIHHQHKLHIHLQHKLYIHLQHKLYIHLQHKLYIHLQHKLHIDQHKLIDLTLFRCKNYTHRNAQVVTNLQQTCSNAVPTTCQQDVLSLLTTCYKFVELNRLVTSYSNNLLSSCNSTMCQQFVSDNLVAT